MISEPTEGPLKGLRVLDFSWAWSGPYGTSLLADAGAEVIKVENPSRPDLLRANGPFLDNIPDLERSIGHYWTNRGKRSISLNLKSESARAVVMRLAAQCDVVVENFSPGVMDRLGIGFEQLRSVNDDIVMLSLSGFGADGPHSSWVSFGQQLLMRGGASYLTGEAGGPPVWSSAPYPDPAGGVMGVFAVLAALEARARTGKGCHIDLSQFETLVSFLPEPVIDYLANGRIRARDGNHDPDQAPHNVYRCQGDENWVAIAIGSDSEWIGLVEAIGRPIWASPSEYEAIEGRMQARDRIDEQISRWAAGRDRDEIVALLQGHGVAATPVLKLGEAFDNQHVRVREYVSMLRHNAGGTVPVPGINWRFRRSPARMGTAAPSIGEDSKSVLSQVLGMSNQEIQELEQLGVIV